MLELEREYMNAVRRGDVLLAALRKIQGTVACLTFEMASFPPKEGDFRGRLFDEYHQLIERIDKLKAFIISDVYDKLPEIDRTDLKEQLKHMEAYSKVLSCRVSRQCNNS